MTSHKSLTRNHVPYNWTYANASVRQNDTTVTSGDLGKLARQLDDNSLWMLTSSTPTWVNIASSSSSGFASETTVQAILVELDGYDSRISGVEGTVSQHSDSIISLNNACDGYLTADTGVTTSGSFDGYIAFFNGTRTISGKLDFTFDAVNNQVLLPSSNIATAPGLCFSGDLDTGFITPSANSIDIVTGALARWRITSAGHLETLGTYQMLSDDSSSGATAPGYSFTGDTNTGMFQAASDALGFSTNGTERWRITSSGELSALGTSVIRAISGSAAAPGYCSNADINTGMYFPTLDALGFTTGGVCRIYVDATGLSIGTAAVATAALDVATNTDVVGIIGRAKIGYNGTTADLAAFAHYDYMSSSSVALRQNSSGQTAVNSASGQSLLFCISDGTKWSVTSAGNFETGGTFQIYADDSSSGAEAPGYSFTGDTNTGIYQTSADSIGFSCGGSNIATFSSTGLTTSDGYFYGKLEVDGYAIYNSGQVVHYTPTSSNIYLEGSHYLVAFIDLSVARTAFLPDATAVRTGHVFIIKDEVGNASVNNITIKSVNAEQTVDGATEIVINTNYGSKQVYSNGTNWFTI